jgi:hypothetical protein
MFANRKMAELIDREEDENTPWAVCDTQSYFKQLDKSKNNIEYNP